MNTIVQPAAGAPLRIALWIVQVILAVAFCMAGVSKLLTPIAQLAPMMPWTGALPPGVVRITGLIDLAGGIGVLLPALTRIQPRLTVLAALGCMVLQVCAAIFHLSRGEGAMVPLNVILFALSAFIFWGRSKKAPILPR